MSGQLIDYLPLTLCDSQNRQSVKVTGYTLFNYIERWGERDSFTLKISRWSEFASELLVGRVMLIPADDTHTDMRCAVIKQIKVDEDSVTVSGNDYLWELMDCRLILDGTETGTGTDEQTGAAETVARHYLNVNCIECTDTTRRDPFCVFEPVRASPLGDEVTIEGRLQTISEVMASICTQGNINIYGTVEEDSSNQGWHIVVRFAVGTDHSQTSEIPDDNWVVLSEEYGNAQIREFSNTLSDNLIIVAGSGTGANRLTLTVGDTTTSGISRREQFLNASDCGDNESMTARGNEAIEDAKSITIKMNLINRHIYGRDFTLGDTVSVDMGIYGAYNIRVTEVETEYTSDAVTVDVTLGAKLRGIVRVIRDAVQGIPLRRQ